MPKYKINAVYEHEGVASGDSPQQAESNFLANLTQNYVGTESFEITQICEDCEGDLDLDDTCFDCRDDEEN
jgi:hypothetical protein